LIVESEAALPLIRKIRPVTNWERQFTGKPLALAAGEFNLGV